jgi:hypothetical protein
MRNAFIHFFILKKYSLSTILVLGPGRVIIKCLRKRTGKGKQREEAGDTVGFRVMWRRGGREGQGSPPWESFLGSGIDLLCVIALGFGFLQDFAVLLR